MWVIIKVGLRLPNFFYGKTVYCPFLRFPGFRILLNSSLTVSNGWFCRGQFLFRDQTKKRRRRRWYQMPENISKVEIGKFMENAHDQRIFILVVGPVRKLTQTKKTDSIISVMPSWWAEEDSRRSKYLSWRGSRSVQLTLELKLSFHFKFYFYFF